MQVYNNGPVYGQHNIDNSISLVLSELRTGVTQLRQLIAAGAVQADTGLEIVTEVEAGLAEGAPTGRLKVAAQKLRDMLSIGGASAEEVSKITTAIAALSAALGG